MVSLGLILIERVTRLAEVNKECFLGSFPCTIGQADGRDVFDCIRNHNICGHRGSHFTLDSRPDTTGVWVFGILVVGKDVDKSRTLKDFDHNPVEPLPLLEVKSLILGGDLVILVDEVLEIK